jgi:sugar phosphate isomerase/epimerase
MCDNRLKSERMHLGIKVGPDNWREKLSLSGLDVRHVEIYYNLAYVDDYPPLFVWLRERGVHGRLHASTPLSGGVFPTLATADHTVRRASVDLTRRTLDVAAREGMSAVVVHPGSRLIPRIRDGRVEVIDEGTPVEESRRWVMEEVLRLVEYGRARGVEPLIENMPGLEYAAYGPVDRSSGVDVHFVPYTLLRDLGEAGVYLCVDIAHLYTELMVDGGHLVPSGNGLYPRVMAVTDELVPYTRHLHLSTITPPWNGTDGHSGFLEFDYALGAIPTRDQLLSWLGLFAGSGLAKGSGRDIWIIPEPDGGAEVHLANYARLSRWLGGIV